MNDTNVCEIDGIAVSQGDFAATLERLRTWMGEQRPRRVATANLDFLRLAHADRELRQALGTSDLVTADGWPLLFLSKRARRPIPERVAGSDLVPALAAIAARDGRRVVLLGGSPRSAHGCARALRARHPALEIAAVLTPVVDLDDEAGTRALCRRIAQLRADLLLVGLGCPKQDLFLRRHLERLGCRVAIGVGGTFDLVAGHLRRAPRWVQAVHAEWLFRWLQEPKRLGPRYARDLLHLVRLLTRRRPRPA